MSSFFYRHWAIRKTWGIGATSIPVAQIHQEISATVSDPPVSKPPYKEMILYCGN
jgi:hypothetical protein